MTRSTTRTATAAERYPSPLGSGAAAPLTTGIRAEVYARVIRLARPSIASPHDVGDWLNSLPPHQFARVARLVLNRPARQLSRRLPAPTLAESVREAVARYDVNPRSLA